jgi:serine/threonine protein phosphatase PrpC
MVAQLYLDGEAKGPIRVMKRNEAVPGLAMTRTIGDRLGKSIGVTSEPLTSTCCIESNGTQYIVLGSDGLWDAMSN